jgi:hypothetical protein
MADKDSQNPKSEIERRHREAGERGQDFYLDPATGYQVMTEKFLLARGHCCESGCRHCPYGFRKEKKS